jgi:hypothetical protein
LGQGVRVGREAERLKDGGVDLGRSPSGEVGAAMEQDLHQAQHAGVLDLDAGDGGAAGGDRQRQALEEREVHVHVEQVGMTQPSDPSRPPVSGARR